ncbi:MAG: UDP-N-acetylmuramoylalanine--D-glutamate ligase [Myxococcota bacterium]|jgi:UDP-N-acetylmuramoylalanine--D-glutamate ligase
MPISALADVRVGILGMGAEGRSVLRALRRAGNDGPVYAFGDTRGEVDDPNLVWRHGQHHRQGLAEVELIVRSPGFPLHHPLLKAVSASGLPMTTATNLFLEEALGDGIEVIGITGSKGKSTTATLAHRALLAAGRPAALVGNIGKPALDQLDEIRRLRGPVVFELSSYQCHDLSHSPQVAVLLDLFPEHMDWHGGTAPYYDAKLNIARHQRPGDRFFYNHASRHWSTPLGAGEAVAVNHPGGLHFADGWFRRGDRRLFTDADMLLRGEHQRRNAVSALAAVEAVGAPAESMQAALAGFGGLPHRNQLIASVGGIDWYDDAISTAPEAAAAAVQAIGAEAHTLIVGGLDRGYDFTPLAAVLRDSPVRLVLLIPDSAAPLAKMLHGTEVEVVSTDCLEDAVALAAARTPAGRACLFSPGSPSYNRFRNFKHRGETFQALVRG